MTQIRKSDIAKIKELDLLTYYKNYGPDELIRNGRHESYYLRHHDSLKLSNGMWYWWSRGIGGKTALDYLIKVEGFTFKDAAIYLKDLIQNHPPTKYYPSRKPNLPFRLPERNNSEYKVFDYLVNERCIDPNLVKELIKNGKLYEGKFNHDAIFVGFDEDHVPRFACRRSTITNHKQDCLGSNKEYSFNISKNDNEVLHVFESVIDLLSFISIAMMYDIDYSSASYLSLSGISGNDHRIPIALMSYLDRHPCINKIVLHLDNDPAGRASSSSIIQALKNRYDIKDKPPQEGKDVNDYLKILKKF